MRSTSSDELPSPRCRHCNVVVASHLFCLRCPNLRLCVFCYISSPNIPNHNSHTHPMQGYPQASRITTSDTQVTTMTPSDVTNSISGPSSRGPELICTIMCPICDAFHNSVSQYQQHVIVHHDNSVDRRVMFTCPVCMRHQRDIILHLSDESCNETLLKIDESDSVATTLALAASALPLFNSLDNDIVAEPESSTYDGPLFVPWIPPPPSIPPPLVDNFIGPTFTVQPSQSTATTTTHVNAETQLTNRIASLRTEIMSELESNFENFVIPDPLNLGLPNGFSPAPLSRQSDTSQGLSRNGQQPISASFSGPGSSMKDKRSVSLSDDPVVGLCQTSNELMTSCLDLWLLCCKHVQNHLKNERLLKKNAQMTEFLGRLMVQTSCLNRDAIHADTINDLLNSVKREYSLDETPSAKAVSVTDASSKQSEDAANQPKAKMSKPAPLPRMPCKKTNSLTLDNTKSVRIGMPVSDENKCIDAKNDTTDHLVFSEAFLPVLEKTIGTQHCMTAAQRKASLDEVITLFLL